VYLLQAPWVGAADTHFDNEVKLEKPSNTSRPIFLNPDLQIESDGKLLYPLFLDNTKLRGRDLPKSQSYWEYAIILQRSADQLSIPIDSTTWVPDVIGYCDGTLKNPIEKRKLSQHDKELVLKLREQLETAFGKKAVRDEESRMQRVERERRYIPNAQNMWDPLLHR